MDIHYNAFISYRHHPEDIRVASRIHRLLERYSVPRAIRKKYGTIRRLFRDKDELPITSNLTDTITRALENSDYLIVICSPHTRESTWVQREIETFLLTHDRSRILTVLASGEPSETIPEILLREEITDPLTGESRYVDVEPLSCDWRGRSLRSRREELPRLAAALLGCQYDELRQRERQYRTRRMAAVFSAALAAALCFAGYVTYNSLRLKRANDQLARANGEIRDNLNQALENQSRYLASASSQLLEEGDRLTAMLLAREGLPDYEGERPYVAEAEYALAEAVGAYRTESTLAAAGSFCGSVQMTAFRLTEDGGTIYILDTRNVISIWNTQTCEMVASVALEGTPVDMAVTPEHRLLVLDDGGRLSCVDSRGQLCWELPGECVDYAVAEDGQTLLTIRREKTNQYLLVFVDRITGEITGNAVELGNMSSPGFLRERYAPDEPVTLREDGYSQQSAWMLRGTSGERTLLAQDQDEIYLSGLTAEGNVLILSDPETTSWIRGSVSGMEFTCAEELRLACYGVDTGECLWETFFDCYTYSSWNTLAAIPDSGDIFCQTGNLFLVLDGDTGSIRVSGQAGSDAVWTQVGKTGADAILRDGSIGIFFYDDGICAFERFAQEGLIGADGSSDCYVLNAASNRVVKYGTVWDENFRPFAEPRSTMYEAFTVGNRVLERDMSGLALFDSQTGEMLWESSDSYYDVLGSADGKTFLTVRQEGCELVAVDLDSGSTTAIPLPTGFATSAVSHSACLVEKTLYYLVDDFLKGQIYLFRYDLDSGSVSWQYAFDYETGKSARGAVLAAGQGQVLIWDRIHGSILKMDEVTGNCTEIGQQSQYRPAVLPQKDGYYLSANGVIRHQRWDGEILLEIEMPEGSAVSLEMWKEQLLVLSDDGTLYRYDMAGRCQGSVALNVYSGLADRLSPDSFTPGQIRWDPVDEDTLLLTVCRSGNLIDTNSWALRGWIPSCYGYWEEGNAVLVYSSGDATPGVYPLYTTEEMITMAGEMLQGMTLTQEQRAYYGLT